MQKPACSLLAVLLAGLAANGQDHHIPIRPAAANQDAAAPALAPAVPEEADEPKTVYVPTVRSERLSRRESLQLTEILAKSIEEQTPLKVVGRPEQADLIFWGSFKTATHPNR